jgi:hypothetical protein
MFPKEKKLKIKEEVLDLCPTVPGPHKKLYSITVFLPVRANEVVYDPSHQGRRNHSKSLPISNVGSHVSTNLS